MGLPIRILVADDFGPLRHAICTILAKEPTVSVCGEVGSYNELFQKIVESNPHIVLMDLRMPGVERFAPEFVKAQLCNVRLLAMSVTDDEHTADRAQSYGAIKFLNKCSLASTLLPAIEECMRPLGRGHAV
jgi:DNA-binding NarL/FixJ family response regulator